MCRSRRYIDRLREHGWRGAVNRAAGASVCDRTLIAHTFGGLTAPCLTSILPCAMSLTTITEQTDALSPTEHELPIVAWRAPFRPSRSMVALLAGILLALAWLLMPTLRWAYDIERAGRLMDVGL